MEPDKTPEKDDEKPVDELEDLTPEKDAMGGKQVRPNAGESLDAQKKEFGLD